MNSIVLGVLGCALSGLFWPVLLRGPEDRASSTSVGLNFPHSASCFYFVERDNNNHTFARIPSESPPSNFVWRAFGTVRTDRVAHCRVVEIILFQ
jgi:hypothetical protein